MRVEEAFKHWPAPFEEPEPRTPGEARGGGRNAGRPERARQFRRLAERQPADATPALQET